MSFSKFCISSIHEYRGLITNSPFINLVHVYYSHEEFQEIGSDLLNRLLCQWRGRRAKLLHDRDTERKIPEIFSCLNCKEESIGRNL